MANTTLVSADLSSRWNVQNANPGDPNTEFLFDMDWALKDKVSKIFVSDRRAGNKGREVPSYFRAPPSELREVGHPHIIIDLLSYTPARSREQRSEDPYIGYTPEGLPSNDLSGLPPISREMPIPYDFRYQVTSFARSYEHDREIKQAMLANDRLSPRGAYLVVPSDNTVRQMFVSDDSPRSLVNLVPQEGGVPKRLFRSIWTLSASAELFQSALLTAGVPISTSLDLTITDYYPGDLPLQS